jgi:hypothetical protein
MSDYTAALFDPITDLFKGDQRASDRSDEKTGPPERGRLISTGIFDALKPGVTTYSLLSSMIGGGELQSASGVAGANSETRSWHNSDGSAVILIFQDGVLVAK